jgi:hypothetical protein
MDLRRLRHGEWIAGVTGFVLLVSLFLHWYGGANAWQSFSVADIVLFVSALCGCGLAVVAATQRSAAMGQGLSAITIPIALAGAVLVVIHALSVPDGATGGRSIGLWLGLAGAVGVVVGSWRSMGDQSFPKGVSAQVEVTPLPAPKPSPGGDER